MLLDLSKFGGTVPRVTDPSLIPIGKSFLAENCRFDRGGLLPLQTDLFVETPTKAGTKLSLFLYKGASGGGEYFFTWITDVNVIKAPLLSNSTNRVYFTEGGVLKSTDNTSFDTGGTDYPMVSRTVSVPAPTTAPACINTTKLVINGNGMLNSTNILDVSPYGRLLTLGGGIKIDTAVKVFGTGSLLFNGTDANVSADASDAFTFGTNAFTIHGWFIFPELPSAGNSFTFFSQYHHPNNYFKGYLLNTGGVYTIQMDVETVAGGIHSIKGAAFTPVIGTAYHIAFIRGWGGSTTTDGGWKIIVNGINIGTTTTASAPGISVVVPVSFVFGSYNGGSFFKGNADELIVINGYAPWTAAFTSPTTPENSDPTLMQTRGYVYTFVTSYGEEGPPSPVSSLIDCYDGNIINLSAMDTAPVGSDVTLKRIYRLNQTASGTADYQFVAEIAAATTTYSDAVLDASLGESLPSAEWDVPPTGLDGLISLPNGILAGFVDNLLCLCVPWFPHAWPITYQKPVDSNIVGLGAFGTTIVVLTEGVPYLAIGNDPANVVLERMDLGFACTSKRGIVDAGDVIIYPSPAGMAAIGSGVRDVITNDYMSPEDWKAYNPTTIFGYYWRAKYVGFYKDDDGVGRSGFMIDLKTKDFVDLDFYATAGFHDEGDGTLYLIVDGNVVEFSGDETNRDYRYTSNRFRFAPTSFNLMEVISSSYPVVVDVYYPELAITVGKTVLNRKPVRMGSPGTLVDACDIKLSGSGEVSAVYLATSMGELPL